jgi:hypothetical protein
MTRELSEEVRVIQQFSSEVSPIVKKEIVNISRVLEGILSRSQSD